MEKTESAQQTQHWSSEGLTPRTPLGFPGLRWQIILKGGEIQQQWSFLLPRQKSKALPYFMRLFCPLGHRLSLEVWPWSSFSIWACFSSLSVIECVVLRGHINWILYQPLLYEWGGPRGQTTNRGSVAKVIKNYLAVEKRMLLFSIVFLSKEITLRLTTGWQVIHV